ncbi:AlpA family transcriptional regulator [Jezberella montanilacus]|uniref:AlpA family transcriptional regulator n=1 Tax=Jezberella montanilacus TaxID=323426 RepID=A0A2T0XFH9_9BURK|nr:AlpA family phage regulatory protein [Jezberella montanilacus]PRY97708.1 AlpA family transcriptional regulator [Jezberella montanilacus]
MSYPTINSRTATLQQTANYDTLPDAVLIRPKQLVASGLVPFSIVTVWRKAKAGTFPSPVKVTPAITAWKLGDVREWLKDPANYKAEVSA